LDIRNELSNGERNFEKIFSLPILNIIYNNYLKTTKSHIESFIENK